LFEFHVDWTYTAIMASAVLSGFVILHYTQQRMTLAWWESAAVGLGGFCGAMLGAKLPFVLADWPGFLSGTAWLDDGKTIMSGLVGGYFGVLATEWALDIQDRMCDRFAVPVAAAVGIGRLGCFAGGCCYGTVTSLPWGVDFGDELLRHPTQLYESAFHLLAAVVLYRVQQRDLFRGQLIRVYFVLYFVYRFGTEFIRPEPALWLGLTGYQWSALVLAPFFGFWCCPACRPELARSSPGRSPRTALSESNGHVLKPTRTLCPACLEPVTGETYVEDGKAYLRRECPQHGVTVALVSSSGRQYYLRDEVPHPLSLMQSCCSSDPNHKTCVALLELTDTCNLRCPVCYSHSPNGPHASCEDLCEDLRKFVTDRGSLEVLQLSGGEPLLHPDLLRIVDYAKTLPVDHIMINTNGLELLRDERLAAELAARRPKLELYLQLDGLDSGSQRALRGADLVEQKRAIIARVVAEDLPATFVATIAKGVNEGQVGELLRLGLRTPQIRGITFQPATWAGRYAPKRDPLDRVTLADVIDLIVEQGEGAFHADDFHPLPCSHPNCCSFTYLLRRGAAIPLTRVVNYTDHLPQLSDRMNFNLADARQCCGIQVRPEDFFRLVIKPFMDAYTYDQDRVDECCVHVIQRGGTGVSFCRYNVLERQIGNRKSEFRKKSECRKFE
jgi:uncharacterized radical SAM superfamily Fe-S cluster-containing enzyme/prolipoprotein diacylglyceryltransferase